MKKMLSDTEFPNRLVIYKTHALMRRKKPKKEESCKTAQRVEIRPISARGGTETRRG